MLSTTRNKHINVHVYVYLCVLYITYIYASCVLCVCDARPQRIQCTKVWMIKKSGPPSPQENEYNVCRNPATSAWQDDRSLARCLRHRRAPRKKSSRRHEETDDEGRESSRRLEETDDDIHLARAFAHLREHLHTSVVLGVCRGGAHKQSSAHSENQVAGQYFLKDNRPCGNVHHLPRLDNGLQDNSLIREFSDAII